MALKFSTALCTFNGAHFLREQLASIAAQTRPPDELVVCDDLSTDTTQEIVEEFVASAPFPVRLYVNERNLGSTKNFERAIHLCTGDVIALADQDDVWHLEKLRRIESCFVRAPHVGLVFSDAEVVDESLRPTGRRLWQAVGFNEAQQRRLKSGRALDVLLPGRTVTGATMAFRAGFRELALEIPGDLNMIHDGWIALVIAAVAEIDFIDEPLLKYRQHPSQQVGASRRREGEEEAARQTKLQRARAAWRCVNEYEELIKNASGLSQRLATRSAFSDARSGMLRAEELLRHLRTRAYLPERKVTRISCVVRELFAGRYHRYSYGFRSAAKDLF